MKKIKKDKDGKIKFSIVDPPQPLGINESIDHVVLDENKKLKEENIKLEDRIKELQSLLREFSRIIANFIG
jgi:hypothetical protein